VSSGSISAVGARRCAAAEPLSVAHGLLWGKKVSKRTHFNPGNAASGHVHGSIGPQRLADVAGQRVDDDFLAAVAKARVPQRGFVEEGTAIAVAADGF
jgi:hypothetical protein